MYKKQCIICGKEFLTPRKDGNTCSEICRKESKNRRTKEIQASKKKAPEKRECPVCGKIYYTTRNKKTCSENCRVKYIRINEFARKLEIKRQQQQKLSIAQENKKARELGMTYGQYQAWKYMEGSKNLKFWRKNVD